jgi:hypothetical protein
MVRRETRSLRAISARERPSASSPATAAGSTAFGGRPSTVHLARVAARPALTRWAIRSRSISASIANT